MASKSTSKIAKKPASKKKRLTDEELRKLQPKLRMFTNGETEVNLLRSGQCASLKVEDAAAKAPVSSVQEIAIETTVAKKRRPTQTERGSLKQRASKVSINVFVETVDRGEAGASFAGQRARMGNLATATVSFTELDRIAKRQDVSYIELGEPLAAPRPIVSSSSPAPPSQSERSVKSNAKHRDGLDVIIGIVDVGGFDFSHEDFLDATGKTRFQVIWDQGGGTTRTSSSHHFGYGVEITKDRMDKAIAKAKLKTMVVPAFELEPQSQMSEGSHGTHVASIAAGNHGVCRKAEIAAVLISLESNDDDRRRSFYDSTRVVDAIEYLLAYADKRKKPISINISLGTNGHAHDGSSALSRWIDSALAKRGRSVCVAAGNAGQELPEHDQDIGHWMGRIHTRGVIAAPGLTSDIDWCVVGNGNTDISENELEIWYKPQDRISVSVRTPQGEWIGPISPSQYIENRLLDTGTVVSIYNEVYHPANGSNYIGIYLSPFLSKTKVVGVASGEWTVRLHGTEIRDGRYDGWIERDDPRRRGRAGDREYWNFPSFFGDRSNIDDSSLSSLACGHRVISVANLDFLRERVNISSSQGPTRDGRFKPDIAAPGTDIVAANGFAGPNERWIGMTGTSMASPYVAGVIGLMLAAQPNLTAAQIEGILHRTSSPLPGSDFKWSNAAGFGRINPTGCLDEAVVITKREDKTK